MKKIAALALAVVAAVGCGTPQPKLTESQEYFAGRAVSAMILKKYPLYDNAELTDYVCQVGLSVALVSDRPETFKGYVFGILDSDEPNALSAPSGFIFLTTGLLKLCKDEDELAGILAHEIAHVNLKHPELALEKARQTQAQTQAGVGLATGIASIATQGERDQELEQLRASFGPVIENVADGIFAKGYEREQEFEADKLGAEFMARQDAGYNPWALVDVLERMSKASKQKYGWLGSTHPAPLDRKAQLEGYLNWKGLKRADEPARQVRFEQKTRMIRK